MTGTLTIYRGLPGSGKTTHARTVQAESPTGQVVRVNRDDLRRMLLPLSYRAMLGGIEHMVTAVQHGMIKTLPESGIHVLCDDTNLNPHFLPGLLAVAEQAGAQVMWVDLTGVPVSECIRRDRTRPDEAYVGDEVIRSMWARHIKPPDPDPALETTR